MTHSFFLHGRIGWTCHSPRVHSSCWAYRSLACYSQITFRQELKIAMTVVGKSKPVSDWSTQHTPGAISWNLPGCFLFSQGCELFRKSTKHVAQKWDLLQNQLITWSKKYQLMPSVIWLETTLDRKLQVTKPMLRLHSTRNQRQRKESRENSVNDGSKNFRGVTMRMANCFAQYVLLPAQSQLHRTVLESDFQVTLLWLALQIFKGKCLAFY